MQMPRGVPSPPPSTQQDPARHQHRQGRERATTASFVRHKGKPRNRTREGSVTGPQEGPGKSPNLGTHEGKVRPQGAAAATWAGAESQQVAQSSGRPGHR